MFIVKTHLGKPVHELVIFKAIKEQLKFIECPSFGFKINMLYVLMWMSLYFAGKEKLNSTQVHNSQKFTASD